MKWSLLTYTVVGGVAVILFLKLVCCEITVQHEALKRRVKIAREQRAREEARRLREGTGPVEAVALSDPIDLDEDIRVA